MYQPFQLDFNCSISLTASLRQLKGNRVADVLKVLKTWCNGWATSNRYHEAIRLPCLFGCNHESDVMEHYMQCHHIFWLWKFMIPSVPCNPLERWGLINSCNDNYKQVACVHAGYHAVRRHFKQCASFQPDNNMTNLSGADLRASWTVFADAFVVEAREIGVATLKFSVTGFLSFLSSGERPLIYAGAFERGTLHPVSQGSGHT